MDGIDVDGNGKGQVTLPKRIRDELGLGPGSEVDFEVREGQVILRKKVSEEKLARWQGYLRGKLPASPLRQVDAEMTTKARSTNSWTTCAASVQLR